MSENDKKNDAPDQDSHSAPEPGMESPEPANDSGEGAGSDASSSTPENRIEELEAELASLKDNALRAMAEAENVRKRAEKQVQDANRYGAASLARDVLGVADNLQRALDAAPPQDATPAANKADGAEAGGDELLANLREGVQMTLRDLLSKLENHGIKRIEPEVGEKFDHNLHQAMFEAPAEDVPPGTVAQVVQPGYLLHDRLLRAAMVGVAAGKAAETGPQNAEPDGAAANGAAGGATS